MLRDFLRKAFRFKSDTSERDINFAAIQRVVRHKFHDKTFLTEAFKHKSFLIVNREPAYRSNERMEFLGDAVLDLVVTEFLYKELPRESEGVLSRIKSILVSRKVLAQIISDMELGEFLLMNRGEEQTGGKNRPSNLANLYEAVLGAIYLDAGLPAAQKFISFTLLDNYDMFITDQDYINYKSLLLEYSQAEGLGIPQYKLLEESGPDHEKHFKVEVFLDENFSATGSGYSKKIAEQNSARKLLEQVAPEYIEKLIQR